MGWKTDKKIMYIKIVKRNVFILLNITINIFTSLPQYSHGNFVESLQHNFDCICPSKFFSDKYLLWFNSIWFILDSKFFKVQSFKFEVQISTSNFFKSLKFGVEWNAWNQLLETDSLIYLRRQSAFRKICH